MKVLFAASECTPFFKSGGLGDVVGALPLELADQEGIDVRVVLPFYTFMAEEYKKDLVDICYFDLKINEWDLKYCGIKELKKDGISYYFIDNLEFFDRPNLYGYDDDGRRFSYFSLAILEMLEMIDFIPDVIHVHDWQTATIPVLLKDRYYWKDKYSDISTVLTLHNLQFQGRFGQHALYDYLGLGYNAFHERGLKQYDDVNFLKAGIYYADYVTTVSPSYMEEIQVPDFAFGLDGVLREVSDKCIGILNGIDYQVNDPSADSHIAVQYDWNQLDKRAGNKAALQDLLGLDLDDSVMLIGMVSRLTSQKGLELIEWIMEDLMTRPVQVVILGTGDTNFENSLQYFNWKYPDKHCAIIDFNLSLAQKIYAGSDLFLMPSAFEPCGLSQMIAMRYGSLPLVHEVGGLKDTVEAYNQFEVRGTGFSFSRFTADDLMACMDQALALYFDYPENWENIQRQAMQADFSWAKSAQQYLGLYHRLSY